ncbi:MAG TPA: YMGG-like glycine zipper-containing protein [Pyrinomonadaceae bacterium]
MVRSILSKRIAVVLLSLALVLSAFASTGFGVQRRHKRVHHSRTKGAIVGGVAGGVGGALLGGKKGAVIGAGAGAGTGYLIQRHRNKRHRRRH